MKDISSLISPDPTPIWYLLASIFATLIGNLLVLVGVLVTLWVNRGRPAAEIHEARARAVRDLAEADEITLRANLTLGEEAMHWTQRMIRAQRIIFELEAENEQLKNENRTLHANEQKRIGSSR